MMLISIKQQNFDADDADADAEQVVEGGEQVDDSCSSAGDFSPGSRQGAASWGNNYLINKLIVNDEDAEDQLFLWN